MSQPHNAKKAPETVNTGNDNNILMQDSPSSKNSGFDESKQGTDEDSDDDENQLQNRHHNNKEEEIDFKDSSFQIPPLFSWPITEETLWDEDRLYVFWALLHLPIPKDPANPMVAVYNTLEEFVTQLVEEDPHFVVFPYHLSDYELIKDLPPPIETVDNLPDDINKWLDYFPQAKPRILGGDTYTALLIGLSIPLPKLVKNLTVGCKINGLDCGKPTYSRNNQLH